MSEPVDERCYQGQRWYVFGATMAALIALIVLPLIF
jgi:hypothetical protein